MEKSVFETMFGDKNFFMVWLISLLLCFFLLIITSTHIKHNQQPGETFCQTLQRLDAESKANEPVCKQEPWKPGMGMTMDGKPGFSIAPGVVMPMTGGTPKMGVGF